MSDFPLLTSVVDFVWLMGRDGHWHSQKQLAKQKPFSPEHVAAAVNFLVTYGFAESSDSGGGRFRLITGTPHPRDVAKVLSRLGLPQAEMDS
jgi:hypothetical protein